MAETHSKEQDIPGYSDSENEGKDKKVRTKIDKMFEKKNLTVLSEHYAKLKAASDDDDDSDDEVTKTDDQLAASGQNVDDDDDDILTLKRRDHDLNEDELPVSSLVQTYCGTMTHGYLLIETKDCRVISSTGSQIQEKGYSGKRQFQ
jgi:hypothetical protein